MPKTKNKYIGHFPKLVLEHLFVVTRFSIKAAYKDKMYKKGYMSPRKYFPRNKGSHDIENHCGYLMNLVLAKIPIMKAI